MRMMGNRHPSQPTVATRRSVIFNSLGRELVLTLSSGLAFIYYLPFSKLENLIRYHPASWLHQFHRWCTFPRQGASYQTHRAPECSRWFQQLPEPDAVG